MRSDSDSSGCVVWPDIGVQKQHQKSAAAGKDIDPPSAEIEAFGSFTLLKWIAAVDVPTGVVGVERTGEACHEETEVWPVVPATHADQSVEGSMKSGSIEGRLEGRCIGGQEPDHRITPRVWVIRILLQVAPDDPLPLRDDVEGDDPLKVNESVSNECIYLAVRELIAGMRAHHQLDVA
jgi:hypothetical protein